MNKLSAVEILARKGLRHLAARVRNAERGRTPVRASESSWSWVDRVARYLWAEAWYNWASPDNDETPQTVYNLPSLSGVEIMNVLPDTPRALRQPALRFIERVEQLNGGKSMEYLYDQAKEFSESYKYTSRNVDEDEFSHLLVMNALGHGVGLGDIGVPRGAIKLPGIEIDFYPDMGQLIQNGQYDTVDYDEIDFSKTTSRDFMVSGV